MCKRLLRACCFGAKPVRYAEALRLQDRIAQACKRGDVPDTVLLLQHHPVYTLGKRGRGSDFHLPQAELQQRGYDVHVSPRGGETTFHGPGQLVMYPIVNLRTLGLGARAYVEGLEETMIRTCGAWGISAQGRIPGRTGVWVGERKVGAVGVKISQGITSHGVALNVNTDLSSYSHIIPCGLSDAEVTSLQQLLRGAPLDMTTVSERMLSIFAHQMGYDRLENTLAHSLLDR